MRARPMPWLVAALAVALIAAPASADKAGITEEKYRHGGGHEVVHAIPR